jgi:hypothetical protein
MDKPRLNFVIDAIMFMLLMAIAGLGLLMKFVLIPGRERWAKYGRNVELSLFGWDRHDWGAIHFYLALALLGVLILHLILHWQMIVTLFRRLIPTPRTRTAVLWVFLLVSLLLIYFPFLITPKVEDVGRGRGRGWHRSSLEERLPPPGPGPAGAATAPAKTARVFWPQAGAPGAFQP